MTQMQAVFFDTLFIVLMEFLPFAAILLLPVLLVAHRMLNDKFLRYNNFDGYKCHSGYTLFTTERLASVLDCARQCSSAADCNGIFYNNVTPPCVGCKSQCDITDADDTSDGSLFYRRVVCPSTDVDWISFPRGCSVIQFRNQSVSQPEAVDICASVGANLVKIDEKWKMDFITEVIEICEGLTAGEYWVDGSNMNASNYTAPDAWRFTDGDLVPMDTYYWASHAPNSPETHHCFRIVGSLWDDKDCSFPYEFICEK